MSEVGDVVGCGRVEGDGEVAIKSFPRRDATGKKVTKPVLRAAYVGGSTFQVNPADLSVDPFGEAAEVDESGLIQRALPALQAGAQLVIRITVGARLHGACAPNEPL